VSLSTQHQHSQEERNHLSISARQGDRLVEKGVRLVERRVSVFGSALRRVLACSRVVCVLNSCFDLKD
jgi:hypothetical protein